MTVKESVLLPWVKFRLTTMAIKSVPWWSFAWVSPWTQLVHQIHRNAWVNGADYYNHPVILLIIGLEFYARTVPIWYALSSRRWVKLEIEESAGLQCDTFFLSYPPYGIIHLRIDGCSRCVGTGNTNLSQIVLVKSTRFSSISNRCAAIKLVFLG